MTPTSSRRARRMVTAESRLMGFSGLVSTRRRQAERFLGLADPAPHGGIAVEMKAALMREAGIGQQRYVGERNRVGDQKARRGQLMLHPRQRRVAALNPV